MKCCISHLIRFCYQHDSNLLLLQKNLSTLAASYQQFKHHSLPMFLLLQSSPPTERLTISRGVQVSHGDVWVSVTEQRPLQPDGCTIFFSVTLTPPSCSPFTNTVWLYVHDKSRWVSHPCSHLSPRPLRENNAVPTARRSVWEDGSDFIFLLHTPTVIHLSGEDSTVWLSSFLNEKPNIPWMNACRPALFRPKF